MSAVYNPEADVLAEIERLELEARQLRQKAQKTNNPADQRVLQQQLQETEQQIELLRKRLP